MRLLANENFPRIAVEALRARGHDVLGASTPALLSRPPRLSRFHQTVQTCIVIRGRRTEPNDASHLSCIPRGGHVGTRQRRAGEESEHE